MVKACLQQTFVELDKAVSSALRAQQQQQQQQQHQQQPRASNGLAGSRKGKGKYATMGGAATSGQSLGSSSRAKDGGGCTAFLAVLLGGQHLFVVALGVIRQVKHGGAHTLPPCAPALLRPTLATAAGSW